MTKSQNKNMNKQTIAKSITNQTTSSAAAKPKAKHAATNAAPNTKPGPAPTTAPTKPARPARPSGLDLAARALADAGEPLNIKIITQRVLDAGWATNGKTPQATLYAAITREIAKKGDAARFRKAERGRFAFRGTAN